MSDFDRIFDPRYTATDLFTDRAEENETFARALMAQVERAFDGTAVLSTTARQNVLTFYGIGGIGKTELSRRLERWLRGELSGTGDWGEPPRLDQPISTVRTDFHGSNLVDAADIVLRLRAAVAAPGRRLPAFDLGLAAWWALARPGTDLPDLRGRDGFDVRGQIGDTVNDLLGDLGVGLGVGALGVRLAARLVEAVRTRRLRDRVVRDCVPLGEVIEAARTDPSPYVAATLAGLLSWDLERLVVGERPVVVAFADAVEYVQGGSRTQERLLNRIVHLTPSVLWVVTSRSSLDWDGTDLNRLLPATGPRIWPGLSLSAQSEPRQHRVGDLSDADVDRYLSSASGVAGNPALGPEVVARIRAGAHGLPLYLDLSLAIARAAADSGGELDPDEFGGPLPELVVHVFADLPEDEREIARTASLVPRFAPDLVAEAAGRLVGDAQRFCRRALVTHDGHALFPYRLHDAVRSAIADESISVPGAWAAADRRDRGAALVEVLHRRHEQVLGSVDHRRDVLELAAALCATHDLRVPWLLEALLDLPGMGQTADRLPPPDSGTWMGQVARFFDAYRGRSTRQRIDYLERLTTEQLPSDIGDTAKRFLAYAHRTVGTRGNLGRALTILRAQLADQPESSVLRYQVARTLQAAGDFDGLTDHLSRYPLSNPAAELRMRADLAYERGEMMEAIAGAAARAEYLRSVGGHRVALENHVIALWRSALIGGATIAACDAIVAEADRYGLTRRMRTAMAAKAVCQADDSDAVQAVLAEAMAIIHASSGRPDWREWSASLIHGLRRGDGRRIDYVREQWTADPRPPTYNYRVVDRLFVYAGYPPTYPPLRMGSDTHPTEIDRRWHRVIDSLVTGDGR